MSGSKTITNPSGAFGYTDLETQVGATEVEFKTSAAVTKGRVVAIGTDGLVAHAATNGTSALAIGVANEDAASGEICKVVVHGMAENCSAAGAIAAGDIVKRSVTTAGYVSSTATPAVGEGIGVAINASASNTVDVWVVKNF